MSLSRRTILIVGLTLLSLMLLLYLFARGILLDSFTQLETQSVRQHVQRVVNVLGEYIATLETTAMDWSSSDNTYQFMVDGNTDDYEAILVGDTFFALGLNLLVLVDNSAQIVYAEGYDLRNQQFIAVPDALASLVLNDTLLWEAEEGVGVFSGLMMMPDGPMLVVSAPVLDSEAAGPIRGTMIWGRYLDTLVIQRLAAVTQFSIVVEQFYDPQLPADFQAARSLLNTEGAYYTRELSEQTIAGYTLLTDIYGDPALILRVDVPRNTFQLGQTTITYITISVLIGGTVFGLVMLLLLERFVLAPLADLTREVNSIGVSSDLSGRVPVQGRDELATLATTINIMLEGLEQSRDDLQRAQDYLQRSAQLAAAGEIAAGVAHQINNPLTAVVVEAHLLLMDLEPDHPHYESVTTIQDAAKRAGSVVQQLLNLARNVPYEMQMIDVNESIQRTVSLIRSQLEQYVINFQISLTPDLPPIAGSAQHLEDVWINLLINARDAIKEIDDAEIWILTTRNKEEGNIFVIIGDNGRGIDPAEIDRVFDPFYTTKRYGTGLGLSLCHEVIQRHGGTIEVNSELGRGAVFLITLPEYDPDFEDVLT